LRLNDSGLMVKAAPERERRHEDRQNGDQTHTHTSPLKIRVLISLTDRLIGTTFPRGIGGEFATAHQDDSLVNQADSPAPMARESRPLAGL
jgi:hypothetical protein